MGAIYNPLKPHKQSVLPEDFKGFNPERIEEIRQIRSTQKIRADMCLVRDSDRLKSILRYRLKEMGFIKDNNKREYGTYTRLARRTGIDTEHLSAYFNHNRYIWNEAKGRAMEYISQTNLLILCLFAGITLSLDIDQEPMELIEK